MPQIGGKSAGQKIPYSALGAAAGSIRLARQPGPKLAAAAHAHKGSTTPTRTRGSCGEASQAVPGSRTMAASRDLAKIGKAPFPTDSNACKRPRILTSHCGSA